MERIILSQAQMDKIGVEIADIETSDSFKRDLPIYKFKGKEIYLSQSNLTDYDCTDSLVKKGIFQIVFKKERQLGHIAAELLLDDTVNGDILEIMS